MRVPSKAIIPPSCITALPRFPVIECRGNLLNEETSADEYFVLRSGELRRFQLMSFGTRKVLREGVYLFNGAALEKRGLKTITLNATLPRSVEYVLTAETEADFDRWWEAIEASIKTETRKTELLAEGLANGSYLHKYNYGNYKRKQVYVWLADEGRKLRWANKKGGSFSEVGFEEVLGVVYGPVTSTFLRSSYLEDPSFMCFSLILADRTVDLACIHEHELRIWVLGLQRAIVRANVPPPAGMLPAMSDAQFLWRKAILKLRQSAQREGVTLKTFITRRLTTVADQARRRSTMLLEPATDVLQLQIENDALRQALDEAEHQTAADASPTLAAVRSSPVLAGEDDESSEGASQLPPSTAGPQDIAIDPFLDDVAHMPPPTDAPELYETEPIHIPPGSVPTVQSLRSSVLRLRSDNRRVRSEMERNRDEVLNVLLPNLAGALEEQSALIAAKDDRIQAMMAERRDMLNQLLEAKGNIRLFARIRPLTADEARHEPKGRATTLVEDESRLSIYTDADTNVQSFDVDGVLGPADGQDVVFERCRGVVLSVLDGFNASVIAYGPTGTNKTETMMGTPDTPGLMSRSLAELFAVRDSRAAEGRVQITMAAIEVHNDDVHDLLRGDPRSKKLAVKEDSSVPGLTERTVNSGEEALAVLSEASAHRATLAKNMEEHSAKSNLIVTVRAKIAPAAEGAASSSGKLTMVQLAGSELVVRKAGVSAFRDVIQSLSKKEASVPYDKSKLTMLLKDTLGESAKCVILLHVSPSQAAVKDTITSLQFAATARRAELGAARKTLRK
uniref:Kinesin motor domain-containing protein n=1 Tax=Vitrella brassicaformis TaxID=1169539 RepID=A0A7S1K0Q8_9ALVE